MGISIDGSKDMNDTERKYHSGKGSYDEIIKGYNHLKLNKINANILCVINPRFRGLDIYKHFLSIGFSNIDFLIPDVTHDSKDTYYNNLSSTPIADYLIPIFNYWYFNNHSQVYIRVFHDIIKKILGGMPTSDIFGNIFMNYITIDTDGNIEAMDTLKICEEGIGKSGLNILNASFSDLKNSSPLMYKLLYEIDNIPLSKKCLNCELLHKCGGGYLPHRYSKVNEFTNPSIWCNDLKKIFKHIETSITDGT